MSHSKRRSREREHDFGYEYEISLAYNRPAAAAIHARQSNNGIQRTEKTLIYIITSVFFKTR